jgi:phosphoadenosine phosphosulfate reductase
MNMWQLILFKNFPPMRRQRYCCEWLKEKGGLGRLVVTGIRWEESPRRSRRRMTEVCYRNSTTTYLHPIIDWTKDDIWAFIHEQELPYCSLYDEGFERLGCILCPLANNPKRDAERWPKIAAQYIRTFDKLIRQRQEQGKILRDYTTGEEMFNWWIKRNTKKDPKEQMVLFE